MKSKKITKTNFIVFLVALAVFATLIIISSWNFGDDKEIIWGVNFSKKQADNLGLNWKFVYWKMLDEYKFIKIIRMPIYWDEVEQSSGKYVFDDYIWMIKEAQKKDIKIIPVLGRRVPRWPECHEPWFYGLKTESEKEQIILNFVKAEVEALKKYPNIIRWQVDNEPFLNIFGECPKRKDEFVEKEIELVRSLDNRQIVITESGELSSWLRGAKIADILGVSLYRKTWNSNWGWFQYPLPPAFYYFKSQAIKFFTGVEKIINTELQVEPWAQSGDLTKMSLFDQKYAMDLDGVKNSISFAKKSGFDEIYLWGVEWWWWMGQKNGDWSYWEYGKTLNK
jgi:hypothetical protein